MTIDATRAPRAQNDNQTHYAPDEASHVCSVGLTQPGMKTGRRTAAEPLEQLDSRNFEEEFANQNALFAEQLSQATAHRLYANQPATLFDHYYQSLGRTAGLPNKRDFKPMHVVRLLPWMTVFDTIPAADGRRDYRCRLIGEDMKAMLGTDMTGRTLSVVTEEPYLSDRITMLSLALDKQTPIFGLRRVSLPKDNFVHVLYGTFAFHTTAGNSAVFLIYSPV